MTLATANLPVCRFCETVLVGAETNACDPCTEELCAACKQNLVEFHTPGLPAQLYNDCHDDWMQWDDPVLAEIAMPFEDDVQTSRERFVQWKQAQDISKRDVSKRDVSKRETKTR